MTAIKLGDQVQHKLTGAKGIVTGITRWLHITDYSITVQPVGLKEYAPLPTWSCMDGELDVIVPASKQ